MKIAVVNGPNLNLLGVREPEIYGHDTLAHIEVKIRKAIRESEVELQFHQSNSEGEIIDLLHSLRYDWEADSIVINPGSYSHYSYAIRDAISAIEIPVVEVHISNTQAREEFRHHSVTAGACVGKIEGLGWVGYVLAILYLSS
ncbi:MAG: type II 3-dehydroquinate dehydratase [Ignavibacteriae bacterium]|nr:type II 3-dehydroquinate dehydratase [Ignavibacteriota bacterium]MCB9215968.1 type II 3-dehydroquinate dehydratase [Ignavibacteria bacterium]